MVANQLLTASMVWLQKDLGDPASDLYASMEAHWVILG